MREWEGSAVKRNGGCGAETTGGEKENIREEIDELRGRRKCEQRKKDESKTHKRS